VLECIRKSFILITTVLFFCSRTSSSARPLTRSDTEVTLNTYWNRLAAIPSLNGSSIGFDHDYKNASGFPQAPSNLLSRSDTVSSWNSTWDEHIVSSSGEGRNEDSFVEYSDHVFNAHCEYGLGASSANERMSDGEDSDSDDDTCTEYGDYSDAEGDNDINMDSEASVHVPIACRSPSLPPSVPATSSYSATAVQYTGLRTRAQTRKIEQRLRQAAGDAEPAQGKAHNKNSQQESVAWRKEGKNYRCNICHETNTRKDLMKRHVRQQHPAKKSNPTGRV